MVRLGSLLLFFVCGFAIADDQPALADIPVEQLVQKWERMTESVGITFVVDRTDFEQQVSTPEQRVALFHFLNDHLLDASPRKGLLPNAAAVDEEAWDINLTHRVRYMIASPQQKVTALARMAAQWDSSEEVRREARKFLDAFDAARKTVTDLKPEFSEIGLRMWMDMDRKSRTIADEVQKRIVRTATIKEPSLLAPIRSECDTLRDLAGGLVGVPQNTPPFIDPNRVLAQKGFFN